MNQALPVLAPFNPLDKRNLAESITDAMLARPVSKLPPSPFIAAGIYAIYYFDFVKFKILTFTT
ncbi:MAG: hypothetical protein ACI4WT_03650 [Oligosphaeraceae bacterium]